MNRPDSLLVDSSLLVEEGSALDGASQGNALPGSCEAISSCPDLPEIVESAIAFLSSVPVANRSEFFRALGSRLLELAELPDEDATKHRSNSPSADTGTVLQVFSPPLDSFSARHPKRPRLAKSSQRLEETQKVYSFDMLPPDVIISHIFRCLSARFRISRIAPSSGSFYFSTGWIMRSRRTEFGEPGTRSTYRWHSTTSDPDVRSLWGCFCRDVFRHPWFLFECLQLPSLANPTNSSFYSPINLHSSSVNILPDDAVFVECDTIQYLVPRVVISTKMLFALTIESVYRREGESRTCWYLVPPTRGFVHLDSISLGRCCSSWFAFISSASNHHRQHVRSIIVSYEVTSSSLLALEEWKGDALSLSLSPLLQQTRGTTVEDLDEVLNKIALRDWNHLTGFHLTLRVLLPLPDDIFSNMKNLTSFELAMTSVTTPIRAGREMPVLRGTLWSEHLKKLVLVQIQITWRHVFTSLDSLERLHVELCDTDDEIFRIHRLPNLKFLLLCCKRDDPNFVCENPSSEWLFIPSNLATVKLKRLPARAVDIFVRFGAKLEYLSLEHCPDVSVEGWRLPLLSQMLLSSCQFSSASPVDESQTLEFPEDCALSNVENLEIVAKESNVLRQQFLTASIDCSKLKDLTLNGGSSSLLRFFCEEEFPTLRSLSLFIDHRDYSTSEVPSWFRRLLSPSSPTLISRIQLRLLKSVVKTIQKSIVLLFLEGIRLRNLLDSRAEAMKGKEQDGWLRLVLKQWRSRREMRARLRGGRPTFNLSKTLMAIGIGNEGESHVISKPLPTLTAMLKRACKESDASMGLRDSPFATVVSFSKLVSALEKTTQWFGSQS